MQNEFRNIQTERSKVELWIVEIGKVILREVVY